MRLARRTLLLGLALAGRPARAGPPVFRLVPGERAGVTSRERPGTVWLPAGARLVGEGRLGGGHVGLVAFAADPMADATCELVAIVGADAAGLRIVGLEVAAWARADGAHLSTRVGALPDGGGLLLHCAAATPGPGRLTWRREAWTDLLRVGSAGALRAVPTRAAGPGTWQAALSARRDRVAALLEVPRTTLPPEAAADAARTVPSGGQAGTG